MKTVLRDCALGMSQVSGRSIPAKEILTIMDVYGNHHVDRVSCQYSAVLNSLSYRQ
jgi:hypothetical protein